MRTNLTTTTDTAAALRPAAPRPRRLRSAVLGGFLLAAGLLPGGRASALFTFTVAQSGTNVLVTGAGTFNTVALTLNGTTTLNPSVLPTLSLLYSGASSGAQDHTGITLSSHFGNGGTQTNATSGTGNSVGVIGFIQPGIYVPTGYVSGTVLADTSTYANITVATLGFTPGRYTATWRTGATADSLVVNVVPEPGTWTLLGAGTLGLGPALRRRQAIRAQAFVHPEP